MVTSFAGRTFAIHPTHYKFVNQAQREVCGGGGGGGWCLDSNGIHSATINMELIYIGMEWKQHQRHWPQCSHDSHKVAVNNGICLASVLQSSLCGSTSTCRCRIQFQFSLFSSRHFVHVTNTNCFLHLPLQATAGQRFCHAGYMRYWHGMSTCRTLHVACAEL